MGNYIEGMSRKQLLLLPPNLDKWLPRDHPARAIDKFVESLDVNSLDLKEDNDEVGRKRYPPKEMLKILIYSYSVGIRSSREIERLTHENIALRWLSGDLHPDYRTIARFRSENSNVLEGLLTKTVKLYKKVYLNKEGFDGTAFIDSTRIYANASGDSFIDEEKIRKRVREIIKEAEETDKKEDEKYGEDGSGEKLKEETLEELEEIVKELANEVKKEREVDDKEKEKLTNKIESLKRHIKIYKEEVEDNSDSKGRVSTTDPDARFMRHYLHGKQPSYNLQVSADRNRIITGFDVVNKGTDHHQFNRMVKRSERNLGIKLKKGIADKGYYNQDELEPVLKRGTIPIVKKEDYAKENRGKGYFSRDDFRHDKDRDVVICPSGRELTYRYTYKLKGREYRKYRGSSPVCNKCSVKEKCIQARVKGGGNGGKNFSLPADSDFVKMHKGIMEDEENIRLYNMRKEIIEPVLGSIKRNLGFRRFSLRGTGKVKGEFGIIGTIYNLMKLINLMGFDGFMDSLSYDTGY